MASILTILCIASTLVNQILTRENRVTGITIDMSETKNISSQNSTIN